MKSTAVVANTSFALSNNVRAVTTIGSHNSAVRFWNAVPAIEELPKDIYISVHVLALVFTPLLAHALVPRGSSCEKCVEGFSGPRCQPSTPATINVMSWCNCVNGKCGKGKCLQHWLDYG